MFRKGAPAGRADGGTETNKIMMSLLMAGLASAALGNVEPVVTIVSAQMRPDTTLTDVVYNVPPICTTRKTVSLTQFTR